MIALKQVKSVAAFAVTPGGNCAPVNHAVIASIGGPYLPHAAPAELAGDIATVLLRETVRPAVPADSSQAAPGPVAFVGGELWQLAAVAPGQILAGCERIDSACQSPDYADSIACRLLAVIRQAALAALAGVDESAAVRGAA